MEAQEEGAEGVVGECGGAKKAKAPRAQRGAVQREGREHDRRVPASGVRAILTMPILADGGDTVRLLTHARFYTLDPRRPQVEALVVDAQGRIVAWGDRATLRQTFAALREEDLGGGVVLPGLTDAHLHLEHYALALQKVDCATPTKAACLERVAERVRQTPPGVWVLGHGWNQNAWPEGFPTVDDLDAVAPEHPVYLTAQSLHAAWVNSAALRRAGITEHTPDPPDGRIGRDAQGRPNGLLFEGAMRLVAQHIPEPDDEAVAEAIAAALPRLWALGLTGVHDFDRLRCYRALQHLHAQGRLRLRVLKNLPVEHLDDYIAQGLRSGQGDDWLRLGGLKAFADGALGPRTAAMLQPYDDRPDSIGMLLLDAEAITDFARRAVDHGWSLTIHAIGDRANQEVLRAYAWLRAYEAGQGLPLRRHRIEHLQLLPPNALAAVGGLGIVASMQPIHAVSDRPFAERAWGARCATAYAWRSVAQQGAVLAFGSDAPVESPNPWWGLHAALNRTAPDAPAGEPPWYPEQCLNLNQALRAYTWGPAYAAGMEDRLGRLAPGYYADLIVLPVDPWEVPPTAVRDLRPQAVMVGGQWVWTT